MQMKNGQVWLFWRGGSWWPTFSRSADLRHWTTPHNVVRGIVGLRPYTKYASDGKSAYLAFTESHPNKHHASIYFLRISKDGKIRDDRGKRIGDVTHGADYRRAGVVYRYTPTRGDSWIMDVAVGPDRVPTIVYVRKPRHQHAGEYRYARLEGGHWKDRRLVSAGKGRSGGWYFYGATLDHEDPSTVYVSRRHRHGRAEVEVWRTPDGGRTWSKTAITHDSKSNNWRPISALGDPGNRVLFFNGRYDSFLDFSTNIFVADG